MRKTFGCSFYDLLRFLALMCFSYLQGPLWRITDGEDKLVSVRAGILSKLHTPVFLHKRSSSQTNFKEQKVKHAQGISGLNRDYTVTFSFIPPVAQIFFCTESSVRKE
jgi:hypothetical protein